jgi:hypothetical protein
MKQGMYRWKEIEGCCRWKRGCAGEKEADENTIVIKADYGIK